MQALDAEIGNATALVIGGDTAWLSIVAAMLHNLGIGQVHTCPVADDARGLLQAAPRDIVVCADDSGAPTEGRTPAPCGSCDCNCDCGG